MLTDEDIRRLDDRFVSRAECELKNDRAQADIAAMREDMRELVTKQTAANKILTFIGGSIVTAIIGIAVASIFGGM